MTWQDLLTVFTTEATLRRYLLGDLSRSRKSRLEKRYFQHPAVAEKLELVEDDLVDAYVRNQLPQADRSKFVRNYLTSETRRRKTNLAVHVDGYAKRVDLPSEGYTPKRALGQMMIWKSAASACVIVLSFLAWQFTPRVYRADIDSITRSATGSPDNTHPIRVPMWSRTVTLQMTVDDAVPVLYKVTLLKGQTALASSEVAPDSDGRISLNVAARSLTPGVYLLRAEPSTQNRKLLNRHSFYFEVLSSRWF